MNQNLTNKGARTDIEIVFVLQQSDMMEGLHLSAGFIGLV
jgi:hypothetical protein